MALFTTTAFARNRLRTSGGGGGKSAETLAYEAYQQGMNLLNQKYLDDYGNPKSEKYFTEANELASKFMPRVSESRQLAIQNDVYENNRARKDWMKENGPVGQLTTSAIKKDIEDMWAQVSTRRQLLQSGGFDVMAQGMEEAISNYRDSLEEIYATVKQATTDRSTLQPIEDALELVKDQEIFYRGIYAAPENYRVDLITNENGEIYDIEFNRMGANDTGKAFTGQASPGGLKIYSNIKSGEDGDYLNVGSFKAMKVGTGVFDPVEGSSFDFGQFSYEDKFSAAPDIQLVAPGGQAYVKNPDGGYFKVDKPMEGYRNRTISEDEAASIESGYQVEDYSKYTRDKEIADAKKASMDEFLASEAGQNYGKSAVEIALRGSGPKFPFPEAAYSGFKWGVQQTPEAPRKRAESISRSAGRSAINVASEVGKASESALKTILKGPTTGLPQLARWFKDIVTPTK